MKLETENLRLICLQEGAKIVGFALDVRDGDAWHPLAITVPLSHLIYRDKGGNRHEVALPAGACHAADGVLNLQGNLADADGVAWRLTVVFSLTNDPYQVAADYRLETDENRQVLRWLGPSLYVGEGSFGTSKDEALFPGLEYLLDGEPSSGTAFSSEKYANRAVPHPYKITVPLMAVAYRGRAVGLMWDPNQSWGGAWRHPAALFSSPNRLQEGARNHWLALFVPSVSPRWLDEGQTEAHTPQSGRLWTLSARFVAMPSGGVSSILRAWAETYGLPPLPIPDDDYRRNVDLCVRSYLDVAWDMEAEGWHHTLSDPWGPRYEPGVANQLWRYGRWAQGEPTLRAYARDQVRRAVARARQKDPHLAPHIDLALLYGHISDALDAVANSSRKAMADQRPDGSWPWKMDVVQPIANFKTQDRLAVMGTEGEGSSGLTAGRVRPVLEYALYTGDPDSIAAARRAADWCNAQRRPEGAQTWELHLHIPDLLAVPYLVNLNLGLYELTGEAAYLESADRWAWRGLPFTYLWNGYYRPIMRYGTVPVFGVTFHDVQPWFGVIVHWNGLVYANSLLRLARYLPSSGPTDWRYLAEGIVRHAMQEQIGYGPYLGMYPDAFSVVKGDEEYAWWLNPQLIGLNTFPLAGLSVEAAPIVLRWPDISVHIATGASVVGARRDDGTLHFFLTDQSGEMSFTVLGGLGAPPTEIVCEGMVLPRVDDVDAVAEGWGWLGAHRAALVKLRHSREAVALRIQR
jgi:hypothetical protein